MNSRRLPVCISIASVFLCLACGADGGPLEACDPLAATEQPIALRDVIAVGEASDGTMYVVDEDPEGADEHAFISEGDELRRVRIAGSGSGSDNGVRTYTLDLEVGSDRLDLRVVIADGETRMAVAPAEEPDRDKDLEAVADAGEELRVLDESAVADMQLRNLPGDIYVEYWAVSEDETQIVVVRPTDDWDHDDFRVFYGMPNQMRERTVVEVVRPRCNGATQIEFLVEGEEYHAHFGAPPGGCGGGMDTYVDTSDGRIDFVRREPMPDALAELTFACFPTAR